MSALETTAAITILNTSMWGAGKTDKELGAALADQYNANESAAKVRKQLISTEAMKGIRGAVITAKVIHRSMTLPWGDVGDRLLPVKRFAQYKSAMHAAIESVERERDSFIKQYEALIIDAKHDLGDMFNADDYPEAGELRKKYGVSYEINPVPSASHFIADVGDEERERIAAEIEKRQITKLDAAMVALAERLEKAVRHLIDLLGTDDEGNPRRIHASTIDALREIAEAIPQFNLTDNAKLDKIAKQIAKLLNGISVDDLRYRSRKPAQVQAVTDYRKNLSEKLSRIAGAYFGPAMTATPVAAESTGK